MKIRAASAAGVFIFLSVNAPVMAADAVPEPEPDEAVEYVKICDAYGSGFFSIPGTEDCMKISGYVRTTYNHWDRKIYKGHKVDGDDDAIPGKKLNQSSWSYRGRLDLAFNRETDYGTLGAFMRLQADQGNGADGDAQENMHEAYITFAGFKAGYGNEYWLDNHKYGADSPAIYDGYYDDDQSKFFQYTYTMGDLSITGGINDKYDTARDTFDWYAGFNYKNDTLELALTVQDDREMQDTAYKMSAIVQLPHNWELGGWFAHSGNGRNRYINGNLYGGPGSTALKQEWGVQTNGKLSDTWLLYGLYSEASGKDHHVTTDFDGKKFKNWTVGLQWTPVNLLEIDIEYSNERRKADLGNGAVYNDKSNYFSLRAVRYW